MNGNMIAISAASGAPLLSSMDIEPSTKTHHPINTQSHTPTRNGIDSIGSGDNNLKYERELNAIDLP